MNIETLCKNLKLDKEVITAVLKYDSEIDYNDIKDKCNRLMEPDTWEQAIKELQEYCSEDTYGMKILVILLHSLTNTYEEYMKKGISEKVFWDTMEFIPRFIRSHKNTYGVSAFTWAWWFPRQLSMHEFRIGEYEYEFVNENGIDKINIHIPSDAKLAEGSIPAIYPFVKQYYPRYMNAEIYCDSWLLAPALIKLLPEDSNIITFQNQFSITSVDEDCPYFMSWLYSRMNIPYEKLPENTTLQRNAKKYLLSGGKIGSAAGVYKETLN